MSFYSISDFIQEYYPEYWGYESYDVDNCVIVHKVDEEWGIFCNFAHTSLVVNGYQFKTSEHLFQMMKFKDPKVLSNLVNGISHNNKKCPSIKKNVKSYEKYYRRDDWGMMVVDAMKFCLQTKYEQSEEFRKKLAESGTRFIVEDQSSFPKKNPDAWGVKRHKDKFVGPNLLGRLLMELRDKGRLEYQLPEDALEFIEVIK